MGRVVGFTFPQSVAYARYDPAVLYVLPNGDNVEYCMDNQNFDENDIDYAVCSVYVQGRAEFKEFVKKHPNLKIVAGGWEVVADPKFFEPLAWKAVSGVCTDFYKTIKQEGKFVKGIIDLNHIPRWDLYDPHNNYRPYPGIMPGDLQGSISTSFGCPFNCKFCSSHGMSPKMISRPLNVVEKMAEDYLKRYDFDTLFVMDENLLALKDRKERIEIIHSKTNAKIYIFASANYINEETVKMLKDNGVYMVFLGMEDVSKNYVKNKNLDEACALLHEHGIYTMLSCMVDPLEANTDKERKEYLGKFMERFIELKAEMVSMNFTLILKGTDLWKEWDHAKHPIYEFDFAKYDTEHAYIQRNFVKRLKIERDVAKLQWDYFNSEEYQKIRNFYTGDLLQQKIEGLGRKYCFKKQIEKGKLPGE